MSTTLEQADAPDWPVAKDGFRLRGHNMTRTEAFTDAAFAFAVTLLVISVERVPASYREMLDALLGVPAFALSFTLLLVFWHGHWQWSRRFGLEDTRSIVLSAALVFTALVYVYPLKYMSTLLIFWLSGFRIAPAGRAGNLGIESMDQLYGIFAVYGVGFTVMALIVALLNLHAYRLREELMLNGLEAAETRSESGAWLILAAVGALSAATALLTPPSRLMLPGWTYMLLPVLMPAYSRRTARARRHRPG